MLFYFFTEAGESLGAYRYSDCKVSVAAEENPTGSGQT